VKLTNNLLGSMLTRDDGQDRRRNSPGRTCTRIERAIWMGVAPIGSSSSSLTDVCPSSSPGFSLSQGLTLDGLHALQSQDTRPADAGALCGRPMLVPYVLVVRSG
jgi:hypothetical protein